MMLLPKLWFARGARFGRLAKMLSRAKAVQKLE